MGQYFSTPPPPPKDNHNVLTLIICFYFGVFLWRHVQMSKNKKVIKNTTSLEQVIGLERVKEELEQYMKFINDYETYIEWDVSVPKGVLLAGPPGTGKTLLVKAIANSLDIPVLSVSGSEFVEMYVGVGASRIRKLFARAREKEKCIIFIDEIDAIGTRRDFSRNSERASTLNQLLVEMDGFNEDSNIMVFAATNLVSKLDPALTRSGRFDKKVYFDLPNKDERLKMYELYLDDDNLDYENLATRSMGLSGADIANVSNQAKINAINNEHDEVTEADLDEALDEIMIGREKRERMLSPDELERVAHHEAGHAIMGYLLANIPSPLKLSIIPRGEAALGFSQTMADHSLIYTEDRILAQISVLLGGRCAEYLIYNNVSTGASDDIEKISVLAENYHTQWGMSSEIGPFNHNHVSIENKDINSYCESLITNIENFTINVLSENKKYLKKLAKKLLKSETLYYKDLRKQLGKHHENTLSINLD